jgi:hypothetical protein
MTSNQIHQNVEPVLSQAMSKRSPDPILSQASISKPKNPSELAGSNTEGSQLGVDFQPSQSSVICGRGKESYNHAGNYRFRMVASMFVKRYSKASSKTDKSVIVSDIVTMIHQSGGMFCKLEKGSWFKVGDHTAREKTSALLRDLLHSQYRSSAKAKIDRRRTENRNKKETQQCGPRHADDSSMASWPGGEASQDSQGQDETDKNFLDANEL